MNRLNCGNGSKQLDYAFNVNLTKMATLIFLLVITSMTRAETKWQQWEFHKQDGPTTLYTRYVKGAQLKAFKATTTLKAPLASVMAIIGDVEGAPRWMHLCRSLDMVETDAESGEFVSYLITNSPWPIKDRDVYIRNSFYQDPDTYEIFITGTQADNYADEVGGMVRIPQMYHQWRITPIDYSTTRLELVGHGKPGGLIPQWIANWVATDMPEQSFRSIHQMLTLDKYKVEQAKEIVSQFQMKMDFPGPSFAFIER